MKEGASLAQALRRRRARRDVIYGGVAFACAAAAAGLSHPILADPVGRDLSQLLFFASASLCLTACIRLIEGRSILRVGNEAHSGVRAIIRIWAVIYILLLGGFLAIQLIDRLPDPLWSSAHGPTTGVTITRGGGR